VSASCKTSRLRNLIHLPYPLSIFSVSEVVIIKQRFIKDSHKYQLFKLINTIYPTLWIITCNPQRRPLHIIIHSALFLTLQRDIRGWMIQRSHRNTFNSVTYTKLIILKESSHHAVTMTVFLPCLLFGNIYASHCKQTTVKIFSRRKMLAHFTFDSCPYIYITSRCE
jgi:hypothetical protein